MPESIPIKTRDGIHPRINDKTITALEDEKENLVPDSGAFYAKELIIDLNTIEPYVSGPNTVKVMKKVSEIEKENIKINKAYLVSCVNSRVEDLAEAANIVRNKKVAEGVEFYIAAASNEVQDESEARGDWQALLEAGAIPLPPGCGPCIGLGAGLLEDGEVGISATNRNFKGRMGSREAFAYLASPAVVAASAVAGKIAFPWNGDSAEVKGEVKINKKEKTESKKIKIVDGFPETISGELIFCRQDNMNTDGIYPGKYTYIDDFKPEDQAKVVMENYDQEFKELVNDGDILVGGFNFGTGSSREQAATALMHRGIKCVVAGSFSATYMRNAINNGFLVLESPDLVEYLKDKFDNNKLTVRTGLTAEIDFQNSKIKLDDSEFSINPVGAAAQELVVDGGLENWVKKNL